MLRPSPTSRPCALLAALALAWPCAADAGGPQGRKGELPRKALPQELVSLDDFVGALDPFGEWYIHSKWGRAWKPRDVNPDWRPYQKGRWAHTDQGWYWVSDEPWGWATYHFGRWFVDALAGWTWIPGRQWAAAWVVWREGKGLAGWAPLGPDGKYLAPDFLFVPKERLGEPVEGVQLPPGRSGQALMVTKVLERSRAPVPPPAKAPRTAPPPALAGG